MLERFLFTSNQQYTPINKLSGGEKRRLFLLRVLLSAPNVLILDEPTNDLDVQTLTVLEDYLESFNGCVITVSHDRYFLDRTVKNIFALEPGGNIRRYPGSYSVYLDTKKKEDSAQKASQMASSSTKTEKTQRVNKPSAISTVKKASNKEKREYESLESKIPKLEAKKIELEKLLYPTPPSDYEELQKLTEEIGAIAEEINTATERWMELAELIS